MLSLAKKKVRADMVYRTKTVEDTINFGKALGRLLNAGDILALQGTLAVGKTQLTKGIAQGLDISEAVTSPTFYHIGILWTAASLSHGCISTQLTGRFFRPRC